MSAHAHDDGEFAHAMPAWALLATWLVLMVLTGATVGATLIDFGTQINLIIAMVIATMKAAVVVAIFMHLLFDKRFNFLIFALSVLGVVLFICLASLDRGQYQDSMSKRQVELVEQGAGK